MQLNVPFDFEYPYNGTASAAKLPTRVGEDYPTETNVTTAGWGAVVVRRTIYFKSHLVWPLYNEQSGGVIVDKLRKVDQQIVSDEVCQAAYGNSFAATMLCAAIETDGISKSHYLNFES